MVKKILLVLILFPLVLVLFAPKTELYYLLEKRLAAQDIVLSGEQVHETLLGLTLEHPTIYIKGIKIATVKSMSLWSLLVYTHVTVEGVKFDPSLKHFVPPAVANVTLTHSLLHPTRLAGVIRDPALSGAITIDLKGRHAVVTFSQLPANSPVKRYLKHRKGGWDYETNF